MVKLIWAPKAADDLEEICEYIASDSEYYAKLFAQNISLIYTNKRKLKKKKKKLDHIHFYFFKYT